RSARHQQRRGLGFGRRAVGPRRNPEGRAARGRGLREGRGRDSHGQHRRGESQEHDLHYSRGVRNAGAPLVARPRITRGGKQRPEKLALRLSTKAVSPSLASSLWNSCCCSSRSTASALSNGISTPLCTDRLMRPTALAARLGGQKLSAYFWTFSK